LGPTKATKSPAENVAEMDLSTSADVYPKDSSFSSMTDAIECWFRADQRFYLKRIPLSNRIRHMPENRDRWLFGLTLASASATLVSIAAAETLLVIACLTWLVIRPRGFVWPSYFIPLCAFMVTTILALWISPEPTVGRGAIYKFWLFAMGLLAANFVSDPERTRRSVTILLAVASIASIYALFQFVIKYRHFQSTQSLIDDPMVNER